MTDDVVVAPAGVRLVIGGETYPATMVRGPDGPGGVRQWAAYGPAHMAVPPGGMEIKIDVLPGRCAVGVPIYADADGVSRFAPQPPPEPMPDPDAPVPDHPPT